MEEKQIRSDLIDLVHHEHEHICRLFTDLYERFEKIAADELVDESRDEMVESAAEELTIALDEMLHHFNQEEEVFFIDFERRFPELAPDVASLVEAHESMCDRTRWLQQQFKKNAAALSENIEEVLDVLRSMSELVLKHTVEEQRFFSTVLTKIPAEERRSLLESVQKL